MWRRGQYCLPVAVSIVFETHSWSEDNERGIATGWNHGMLSPEGRRLAAELHRNKSRHTTDPYPGGESWTTAVERVGWFLNDLNRYADDRRVLVVGHIATFWGIVHRVDGTPVADLVSGGFDWQLGWEFELTSLTGAASCK